MKELLPPAESYARARDHFEDDDFIDRLNSRWTVRALITCIFLISAGIFGLKHISCWTPQEFGNPQIEYANSICFQQGSYYLPTEEIDIPDRTKPRIYYISYYQWTPFILLGMVFLFLLPRFLWHTCPRTGGINISRLVKGIKDDTHEEKGLEVAIRALRLYLNAQRKIGRSVCHSFPCPKIQAGHVIIYFNIKLLYILNAVGQFFLLHYFLSFEFRSYGFEALRKLQHGEDWFESPRFPRVTMCDFMIRRLGSNQHWYSVQCNLPFNMYNEKIFFGIWIWLIVLVVLNIISAITWVISLTARRRKATIERYLKISRVTPLLAEEKNKKENEKPKEATTKHGNEEESRPLISSTNQTKNPKDQPVTKDEINRLFNYLQLDGYLIFRLITRNTSEIVAGKIIRDLNKLLQAEREAEEARSKGNQTNGGGSPPRGSSSYV